MVRKSYVTKVYPACAAAFSTASSSLPRRLPFRHSMRDSIEIDLRRLRQDTRYLSDVDPSANRQDGP